MIRLLVTGQNEYFLNSPKWGMVLENQMAQFAPVFGTKTTYFVSGDTLLNGTLFVKLFEEGISFFEGSTNSFGNGIFSEYPYTNPEPIAFLRSENGSIYKWDTYSNDEVLLYNFDVAIGDVFHVDNSIIYSGFQPLFVSDVTTVNLGGFERKIIHTVNAEGFQSFPNFIEGVGTPFGPWHGQDGMLDGRFFFQCFALNGSSYQVNLDEPFAVVSWLESISSVCEFVVEVDEFPYQPSIQIYPNPSASLFFIESKTPMLRLVVRSITGAELRERIGGSRNFILDLSTMATGIYFCEITFANHQTTTIRVVKQ